MTLVRISPQNVSTPVVTKPEQFNAIARWDTNWLQMELVAKVCKLNICNISNQDV